jgi:hypothetical protein
MPKRPRVPHRSPLPPAHIRHVGRHSNPSAVVAGSTFLQVADLHNILQVVARRPSLGCKVAADIHTALAVRTGLAGHHNSRLGCDKVRFGFGAEVILGLSCRTDQHHSALAEGR